jgi:hypothetical protein
LKLEEGADRRYPYWRVRISLERLFDPPHDGGMRMLREIFDGAGTL